MDDFKDFERIWSKENNIFSSPMPPVSTGVIVTGRQRLSAGQLSGAIVLLVLSILNITLLLDGSYGQRTGSLALIFSLISILCIYQSWQYLGSFRKLRMIDPTAPPAVCLNQWLAYNDHRKKNFQRSINSFNIVIGLLLNVFVVANAHQFNTEKLILILVGMNIGLAYAYIFHVRNSIRKQTAEIDRIITELESKSNQIRELID